VSLSTFASSKSIIILAEAASTQSIFVPMQIRQKLGWELIE
jgi:hypothetical protein